MTGDPSSHTWFSGNYPSWAEARRLSRGYDEPSILEKVRHATLHVIAGRAACERDSLALPKIEYFPPLLECLLLIAAESGNRLCLLDFGGSLGSSYWQHRGFLTHLERVRWCVVEQPHFVAVGRAEIANECLCFHETIAACLEAEQPDAALLSGVLQCLEDPYGLLGSLLDRRLPFVVLDRTQFFVSDLNERITIETVHPAIYEGSYPSWFFNLGRFRDFVTRRGYEIAAEFDSWEKWVVDGDLARNKGFLLRART